MARGKQIIKINEKSISECLATFIRSCEIKNLSPRTIQTYQSECNYFVATGNRLSTVVNLKVKDLDFTDNLIKLNVVKNRKQQYVLMSSGLKQALKLYLSLWDYKESDYLFPEYEGGKLTARGAYDAIRKYNINRGVTKTSIHLFRHTFEKNYIIAGGDCTYLQRLLGHSTLTMTNHYLNLYSTDLQKNYDLFNPLDNLTKQSEKQ